MKHLVFKLESSLRADTNAMRRLNQGRRSRGGRWRHCALNRVLRGHFLGINVTVKILVVFEVPARPQVKGMSGNS